MKNKIEMTFENLKSKNKKALLTYITAGDPTIGDLRKYVSILEKQGSDIIEIGIPYSDPLADGPIIERAAERALSKGLKIDDIFREVSNIRKETDVPLVFLVYYNSIFKYGEEKFIDNCLQCEIDGIIIPDLPLEERKGFQILLKDTSIALIPLVSPVSKERIKEIVKDCKGFVYCISSLGVTGKRETFEVDIQNFLEEVRKFTHLPLALGFGISNEKAVKELKSYADGLIVGSALVEKIEKIGLQEQTEKDFEDFIKGLYSALQG